MFALIPSLLFTLLALWVLRGLLPVLRTRRFALGWVASAAALHLGWALLPGAAGAAFKLLATLWLVTCLVSTALGAPTLLVSWLVRRLRSRWQTDVPDPQRRSLLLGATVPAAAVVTSAAGALGGINDFVIRREQVRIRGLHKSLDGFRIGHLTDIHVGPFVDPQYLQRVMQALNAENVHLQVMTGDLVDQAALLEPTFSLLETCSAPLGMLAVLGNHDKRRGLGQRVLQAYEQCASRGRLRLLQDQNVTLQHHDAAIRVVGVDYPMGPHGSHALPRAMRDPLMRASAEKAFQSVSPHDTTLCLSHHPDFFDFAAERGAALTLAGHTHGAQLAWAGRSVIPAYRYMLGRYQLGDAHLYVSGGTGHWLPFRLGVPTEIAVLTLRSA